MKTVYISDEDLVNSQDFYNKISDLAKVEMLSLYNAEIRKPLEDEIERLNKVNSNLMFELRAVRDKFLEFQDSYVKSLSDILRTQPQILKFEDAKGLHNTLIKQERQKVIAELEEWVKKASNNYISKFDINGQDALFLVKQKLNEMKGEKQ